MNLNFAGRMLEVDMSTLPYAQTGGRADLSFTFVPAHGAIALVPEYYRAFTPEIGGYAAFSVDLGENSLSVMTDVSGIPQITLGGTQTIRVILPTDVLIDSFTLVGVTSVTGFTQEDLQFEGRTLLVRMSGNTFASGGGTINMTFSYVPAPGAMALTTLAGFTGARRRRL